MPIYIPLLLAILPIPATVAEAETNLGVDALNIELGEPFPLPALTESKQLASSGPYIRFHAPASGFLSNHFTDIEVNLFHQDRRLFRVYSVKACESLSTCDSSASTIITHLKKAYPDLRFYQDRNLYISNLANKQFSVSSFVEEGSSYHALRFEVSTDSLNKELDLVLRKYISEQERR